MAVGSSCIPSTASIRADGFCDKMEQGVSEPGEECLARFRPMPADLIWRDRLGSVLRVGPQRRRELPTPADPKSLRPRGVPRTSCSLTATVPSLAPGFYLMCRPILPHFAETWALGTAYSRTLGENI